MSEQQQPPLYGGQAVVEGVMIRGRDGAVVAVREPDQGIAIRSLPQSKLWLSGWRKTPFLRGISALAETLVLGMKALSVSANLSAPPEEDEKESGKQEEALSGAAIAVTLTVALAFAIGLFFLVPLFLSRGLETFGWSGFAANVAEGLLRAVLFIGYLYLIGRMKDIQRMFAYHGAEHMSIHALEHGDPLTPEGLRRHDPAHPRCGTAFLLTVVLISIVAFMFFPREPLWLHVVSRVVLIPVVAAASYEVIRYFGRNPDKAWVRVARWPSLMLQRLTTRWPDDDQCEVAIAALKAAIAQDAGESVDRRIAPAGPLGAGEERPTAD